MSVRTIGFALLIIGAIGVLLFALADVIGIGQDPGAYGSRQTTGTFISAIVIVIGVVMYLRRRPTTTTTAE